MSLCRSGSSRRSGSRLRDPDRSNGSSTANGHRARSSAGYVKILGAPTAGGDTGGAPSAGGDTGMNAAGALNAEAMRARRAPPARQALLDWEVAQPQAGARTPAVTAGRAVGAAAGWQRAGSIPAPCLTTARCSVGDGSQQRRTFARWWRGCPVRSKLRPEQATPARYRVTGAFSAGDSTARASLATVPALVSWGCRGGRLRSHLCSTR
jgi:hypothetical protein